MLEIYHPFAINRSLKIPFEGSLPVTKTLKAAIIAANRQSARNLKKKWDKGLFAHACILHLKKTDDNLQWQTVKWEGYASESITGFLYGEDIPCSATSEYEVLAFELVLCDNDSCPCRKRVEQLKTHYPNADFSIAYAPRARHKSKECDTCHQRRPLTDFVKLWDSADGRGYTCRYCRSSRTPNYSAPIDTQVIASPQLKKPETAYDFSHLKLSIELIPSSSWYNNMRKFVTQTQWKKIRQEAILHARGKCEICGATPKSIDCHERWEYDEVNKVQTLKGFVAICKACHLVKHIGLTSILAGKGQIDMQNIIEHFMHVNNCEMDVFLEHRAYAYEQWRQRSSQDWKVDFGDYKALIPDKMLLEGWIV